MTRKELLELTREIRQQMTELAAIEVKSAKAGTPKRAYEALSALANRSGGGVILFGLAEQAGFAPTGVGNAQRLQEELAHVASAEMDPVLRLDFTVVTIEDKTVVAVEIPEVPPEKKPCYYRPAGLPGGAYIRVGNTNRRMTDYEVFGYVSARRQPVFDEDPVPEATMDDLDPARVDDYLNSLRRARPRARHLNDSIENVLQKLRIARMHNGVQRPSLAGLLMFGAYPQQFEPQLVITFLQYYGTTEAERTPRGERFLDNQKFEGPIPDMIEQAVRHVMSAMRKSSLIDGLYRRDIPEYPEEAIREAIVNAIAHRDYSHYVRGGQVQVRMFADRLEVHSPGGLHGNVTEDNLEEVQSTRNRVLMRLMEDSHIAENRGSGIDTMLSAMRSAMLEPPRFKDTRALFSVTFLNHTLMNPEAVTWLNQFATAPLNDRQRLALVFARDNQRITNKDYQRLNHVTSVVANRELRGLVKAELTRQHGTRRGTFYTLAVRPALRDLHLDQRQRMILDHIREYGSIKRSECQQLLGVTHVQARYILTKMRNRGALRLEGSRKAARYVLK